LLLDIVWHANGEKERHALFAIVRLRGIQNEAMRGDSHLLRKWRYAVMKYFAIAGHRVFLFRESCILLK
jgi:hypothetical protein